MTASTAKRKIEKFPHPKIRPIAGQPNFEDVVGVHLRLNTNEVSMNSKRVNGRIGLLYLSNPTIYGTHSIVDFDPPTNPGHNPTIPENSTGL